MSQPDVDNSLSQNEKDGASSPRGRQRRRRWFFVVAAIFTSGFIAILLMEVALRLFVPVTDVPFQFWDPVVGPRRFPNQRGLYLSGGSVRSRYHYNSQGWNYPEDFQFERSASTRRVCIVGDSYVDALQVDCDKQMAVEMEKFLSAPGRPVQCYPFGVTGYGVSQEYQLIHHYVLDYRPDVVIIFFTANDVYDASPYLSPVDSAYARYQLNEAGELERMPMTSWSPSDVRRWAAKLALARYVLIQKQLLNLRRSAGPAGITLREASANATVDEFPGIGLSRDERGRKSWALVERLLRAAKSDCQSIGATLALVYRGNLPEIDAVEDGQSYVPPAKELDPYCLDQRIFEMGKDFLAPLAGRLDIPYLDLTTPLVEEVRRSGRPHNFPDDDHYNEMGHSVAANAMAVMVQRLLDQRGRDAGSSHGSNLPTTEGRR